MSDIFMNTKEVADYLDIHEKQVYALIKAGRIPATKATGKWIFPKGMIDEWIETQAKAGLHEAKQKSGRIEGALLAAGSNDPVLDLLLATMQSSHPEFHIFTAGMGSTAGLTALGGRFTDIAWTHLFDPERGGYNTPEILAPHLPGMRFVVAHLFNRDIGLIVSQGNPLHLRGFDDLLRLKPRIVNRQKGAGTRLYLDHRLRAASVRPEEIPGYDHEVFTHLDVGLSVLAGEADAGIASMAVARLLGLDAIPLATESFDMVMEQSTFFVKGVQAFIGMLQTAAFRDRVMKLGGYDFTNTGRVLHAAGS